MILRRLGNKKKLTPKLLPHFPPHKIYSLLFVLQCIINYLYWMKRINYLYGDKVGNCFYIKELPVFNKKRRALFLCGNCKREFDASINTIKKGQYCGCVRREDTGNRFRTHGFSNTKLYKIWKGIKKRCYNPNDRYFCNYGGNGVLMQSDWINDFIKFKEYVIKLDKYDSEKLGISCLTIDRIRNNGNYEEDNLRWSLPDIQAKNRGLQKNNTSGYAGVHYIKSLKKYLAVVNINKKRVNIGYAKTAIEASKLRINYIKTHKNTGYDLEAFRLQKKDSKADNFTLPTT